MPSQKTDSVRSFWHDLAEEAATRQLSKQKWFRLAQTLSEEEGRVDFINRSTFYRWVKGERKEGTYWPWSGSVQYIVRAVVGLEEENWKPWRDRWDVVGDGEVGETADEPKEREKTSSRGKWYAIAASIAGIIAAIVSIIASLVPHSGRTDAGSSNGAAPSLASPYSPVAGTSGVREKADDVAKDAQSEQDLIDKLRARETAPPTGSGPWAFVVVDTQKDGVFARSTNETVADRLGFATEHSVVFAECQAKSSFTPPGVRRDVGPVWLRVRWKNMKPSTAALQSDPSDPYTAWMYRGYLEPFDHNGELPQCA